MIKKGSTVKIHYTLSVDGVILDSSAEGDPLVYVQGSGQIIPGLEYELEGLKAGDKKEVTVAPEKGYGSVDPNAFQKVPRGAFENAKDLKVGDMVSGQMGEQVFNAVVSDLSLEEITLDFNHPLAGKVLRFAVEVVDVTA
ncbi:MAG TPA: peptidylprolyl isomerase [bacterium]|nr:peptidylprolyl isomerase [bacterium]